MSLEIPFVPLALLVLLFLAALIVSLRPSEGYRQRLAGIFRHKSPGARAPQFYNAFGEQPRKIPAARFKIKVPETARGWMRHGRQGRSTRTPTVSGQDRPASTD